MRVRLLVAIALSVLCAGTRAHAQPGDPRQRDAGYIGKDIPLLEIDDCAPPPQVSPEQLRKIGFEHFDRGEVLYVQGDYKGAVKELVAAYCIVPFYRLLKDIGQAYERELDYERAIAYLERYVMAVPKDAKPDDACSPDPQVDRTNVIARINVLQNLRAKILINTDPPDARITLANDAGIAGRGSSGQVLEVLGGRYQLQIERDGYHAYTQEIRAEIGKPYTIFTKLEPVKKHLFVRVVPADARLFLDKRQVGTGAFETELPGGRYTLSAEAPGRLTVSREVEVVPTDDTHVSFELPAQPQFGRRQLLGYATVAGGAAGGLLAGATENPGIITAGIGTGLAAGFFGTYFGMGRDIPLGTSSLTITSSLIGGTLSGGTALVLTDDPQKYAPAIGGGLLLGGGIGYYAGKKLRIKPGDAAVINSGALWGTVTGTLFQGSFNADRKIGAGLVLSGLGMGTVGGVLLTNYFDVSRGRAALIDVGGVVGVFVGIAIESVVAQSAGDTTDTGRTTNYTLGGLGVGLLVSGILTRNMDAPNLSVSPVVSKTTSPAGASATTFGIGGEF